ncbi:MAG: 4-hydroxy-tetrahydrodipicolinate synthase [Clostridium sp. 26_22]|nr:MAG: 4-hydroxy-tetrahydrodipicolinate synthase [Clostridium sp. 26_22]
MKKILFKGVGSAVPTPFDENGVNISEFRKFLQFQIDNNVDALIVCGTTGESSTMTRDEKIIAINCVLEVANEKIPVIVGTGSNNTREAIEMSKIAERLGANGILVVTPYYNKTTQRGLIAHYKAIAESVSLPIILYNVPSRTGVNIEPQTCLELSKIDNIVAIKEASGNISQVAQISNLCGDNLYIYSGNDDQIVPICSLGGIGVISVLSNIKPKFVHDMVYDFLDGNIDKARKMQLNVLPLINSLFSEVNPIPVKYALNELGFNFGVPRLPLVEFSDTNKKVLRQYLKTDYYI